jgi:hypothetical protein
MKLSEFCQKHRLVESDNFAPDRLFASRNNKTSDPTRLSAFKFQFFRFDRGPGFPAAIACHTVKDRSGELIEYAHRHRCGVETFPSWYRAGLVTVVLHRRSDLS